MWQISFFIFLVLFCIFTRIMIFEPRTLWCGAAFFWTMVCLAVSIFFVLSQYSQWLASHEILLGILAFLAISAMACVIAFPAALIVMFFIEGIKLIRHEGPKPANLLSILFAVLLYMYLTVFPMLGNLGRNTIGTTLYTIVSFAAIYLLSLMATYSLSASLNLIHLKKKRNADYIIVLGAGIIGTKVTPLLAARIERGIELLQHNPDALLIMSGGQGAGEDIPESQAMAAYAVGKGVAPNRIILEQKSMSTEENLMFSKEFMVKENARIVIVTTAYHVFRALLLARQQGIKCIGFGAKTKWYFTLNALLREFAGYLRLTWKKHAIVIGIAAGILSAYSILKLAGILMTLITTLS